MTLDERLVDLVMRAEELREEGRPASPEELCRDCPELLPDLRRLLSGTAALDRLMHSPKDGPQPPGDHTAGELGRLREYVLLEKIGQGGMGTVYRALHTRLDKVVAVKTLTAGLVSHPEAVARFGREMKAVGKLNHPNIIQATDAGEVEGVHFLVMEYVEGADLARVARRVGRLRVADACEVARQAAHGLAHAHERGLIHRDVKPSNLLLSAAGQVKLLDLGLARLQKAFTEGGSTITGVVLGTFDYMAPEQGEDAHAVTARADVYSLGCTLYHLLTGRPPFAGRPTAALKLRAHATEPVPPVRAARAEVPEALAAVLARMLAKGPAERYAGAAEVAEALGPFAAGADLPALAARAGADPDASNDTLTRPAPARRRRRVAALAAAALLVVAALGVTLWLLRPGPRGPAPTPPTPPPAPEPEAVLPAITFPRPAPAPPGEVRAIEGAGEQVNCLAVSRDGKYIVSGGNDAAVIVRDAATGKELRRAQGITEVVWAVAVSPDGRFILAGGGNYADDEGHPAKDFDLHLIDLGTGAEVRRLAGHTNRVSTVAFTPDGLRAVSCGSDGTVRTWDVRAGKELHRMDAHADMVNALALSRDGKLALTGADDGSVRLWDVDGGREVRAFDAGHAGNVIGVALSPDGKLALTGGLDHTMRLWDVATGKEVRRFPDHPTAVTAVAFSPDGRRALSGSGALALKDGEGWEPAGFDYSLRVWDVATARELHRFDGHESGLTCAAFMPDGFHALSGSSDATLRLWRLPEPLAVAPFSEGEAREQQKRWADLLKKPATMTNSLGMELSLIPPGEFARDEHARARVTRPFYVGRCEVTVKQFREFVEATKYKTEAERSPDGGIVGQPDGGRLTGPEFTWRHKDVSRGDDYPVGQMAWNDAVRFCEWLSKKEGKVYRLPTEAEWEWACRAGTATAHFFGDGRFEDYAWVLSNSEGRSHPVGRLRPNPWGLFDLYGNHAEFCSDWYGDYPAGTVADPAGPAAGDFRVIRGGGHFDAAPDSGSRFSASPDFAMSHFGFRVACEAVRDRAPAHRFTTLIDADLKGYEAWLGRLRGEGFRPVFVQVRDAGGEAHFQGIALRDGKPIPWEATLGLDEAADIKRFNELSPQNYRTVCSCGYRVGDRLFFTSLYVRDAPPVNSLSLFQMTNAELLAKVAEVKKDGLRAAWVQGYADGQQGAFAVTFVQRQGPAWDVQLGVGPARLDTLMAERRKSGFRPISLGGHQSPVGPRFSVVWQADKPAVAWECRSGLTAAQYREEEDAWASRGYRPLSVVGYDFQGKTQYAAVWVRDGFGEAPFPRTGRFVPELEPFDRAMTQFMRDRHIPAGTLAVVRDGKLVLSRGYGYADRNRSAPVADDAPFRLASLTKMMTAAAIGKLIRDGKLTRETKVYDLLAPQPPPGQALDPRWKKVTVGQLLDHQGGWDVDGAKFDPMFYSAEISAALGKPGPATPADVIHYMAGQPLQFEPGTKTVYSNFGYSLLGRVIEKVSGKAYLDYLRSEVLEPIGAKGVAPGRTLPADRDPREPFYSDPERAPDVMHPERKEKVPDPDGGFCLESLDAVGGLTASAADVARFLAAYSLEGKPADRDPSAGAAFGSLPGTFTMALKRGDGVGVVVLFNQRTDPSGLDYFQIEGAMNRAADEVRHWPAPER
jgi:WD40 repeat protein/CubicO group peptidase (beta-lactamase class C family)